ncbi:hypothetical protein GCM10027452_13020 [Micromonospora halotolerans]
MSVPHSRTTLLRGRAVTYTVSTSAIGGFTEAVALKVTGLPTGSSASFTPNPVSASGAPTLRVSAAGRTPRGTFTMAITGISASLVHHTTATLVVR